MKMGDKVIVYGYIDGCSYETTGQTNFIISLETGERVEVPIECVIKKDQVVKKDEIKLKDIIRRINRLDENTKTYWLDTILNWFRLDFGLTKYRQGYEQGKFEGMLERDRVTIPQYIADKIEYCKESDGYDLFHAMDYSYNFKECASWLEFKDNMELFARSWLDGYEVEEEKRYLVKMKGFDDYDCYLNKGLLSKEYFWESKAEIGGCRTKHTRKQLEEDGFGWVFDCEGIEIEEVEE